MSATQAKALEDFQVGQRIVGRGRYEMTPERIRAFAQEYDPQPIHLDEAAARSELFGGIVASGWHSLSATMRLMVESRFLGPTPLVGISIEGLRFVRPVRPGDRLRVEAEVLDVRRSRSRPGQGFMKARISTLDQNDTIVLIQEWTMLLPSREPSADP